MWHNNKAEKNNILEHRCEPGHVEEQLTVAQVDRLTLIRTCHEVRGGGKMGRQNLFK